MTYEGWSNRATWNVALWLNNDEPMYREKERVASPYRADKRQYRKLGAALKNLCRAHWGTITPDNIRMVNVNWSEIGKSEMYVQG